MSFRRALRLCAAYAVALIAASGLLGAWLFLRALPFGPDVVSVWRSGTRAARLVTRGDPRAPLAAELTRPDATLVIEHVAREGRVVTLGRRLFALSFLAGRDGVHASLGGHDAYLSPDDLLDGRLYRSSGGIDADGVLERLSRELGSSKEALWKHARFRRFTVTRTVTGPAPEAAANDPDPVRRLRQETRPTGDRLVVAVTDAALFLASRLRPDGRFTCGPTEADASGACGWQTHARAALLLAESGRELAGHQLGSASRRAGGTLLERATADCGSNPCIGAGDRAETDDAATALIAYAALASERVGVRFRAPAAALAGFVRAQQRDDGGFVTAYDRRRNVPIGTEQATVDADAVLALARAYRVTHDASDLEAATRGLQRLISRPGVLGARDYLGADPRICEAADDLAPFAPDPTALAFCDRWADWSARAEIEAGAPIAEYRGGVRPWLGAWLGWTPDIGASAAHTAGLLATVGAALHAGGTDDRRLRPLDVRAAGGLELLVREQLPGPRRYMLRDADLAAGAFATNPLELEPSVAATATAGAAMLRCLRLLESRGFKLPAAKRLKID
jgi:hypothetical protein